MCVTIDTTLLSHAHPQLSAARLWIYDRDPCPSRMTVVDAPNPFIVIFLNVFWVNLQVRAEISKLAINFVKGWDHSFLRPSNFLVIIYRHGYNPAWNKSFCGWSRNGLVFLCFTLCCVLNECPIIMRPLLLILRVCILTLRECFVASFCESVAL